MVDDDFFFIPLHFPCPCLSLLRSWLVFVIYPFAHWRSLYVYMNMRMQFECQCYRSSLFFGVIWSAIHIIWSLCIYYLLLYQWSIQFIAFNQNKFFITSNYLTFSQMVGSVFHHQHRLKKKSGFVHHIQVDTQVESIIYDDDDNKRHLVKCFFFFVERDVIVLIWSTLTYAFYTFAVVSPVIITIHVPMSIWNVFICWKKRWWANIGDKLPADVWRIWSLVIT